MTRNILLLSFFIIFTSGCTGVIGDYEEPDYKLVLPWHFKAEIISRELYYLKKGGKLIFPLPLVTIISKNNYRNHVKKH